MDTLFVVVVCILIGIAVGAHASAWSHTILIAVSHKPASRAGCGRFVVLLLLVLALSQLA